MTSLAIIPARGGSKRIPRKNIKSFCGKPILSYSIAAARESGCFDEIMVSTDDPEIAEIARLNGATVPFLRSEATSNDHAGILEVLQEVVERYRTESGKSFDSICCILPTAPLILHADIARARSILDSGHFDSVFPVVRFSYPILRSLKMDGDRVSMIWPENYSKRSQDLSPAFHDVGQFYWMRPEPCFSKGRVFTDNSSGIEIPELRVQDIDTDEDWRICELKHRFLNRKRVLILTEAGPDIGMGHATRCRSLARKFEDKDCTVTLWVHSDQGLDLPGGIPSRSWWEGDEALLEEVGSVDLVVLDSFRISKMLLDRIQKVARGFVSIDDYPRREYATGLVVDWTVGAKASWFPRATPDSLLLGPGFCSLRPAYWNPAPRTAFHLRRVLVSFGGTDVRSLTLPCLDALCNRFPDLEFHAVVRTDTLASATGTAPANLRVHSDLDDNEMAALMRHCQLAVCGGGQTLYELASCGCPAVAIGLVDNQMDDIRGFQAEGSLRFAGEWDAPDLWEIVALEVDAFRDPQMLETFSRKGSQLVDGRGAERLVEAILGRLSGRFR
jgi:N-acylneuraminate cytidylyltransferase